MFNFLVLILVFFQVIDQIIYIVSRKRRRFFSYPPWAVRMVKSVF